MHEQDGGLRWVVGLAHRDLRISGEGGDSEYFLTQERAAVDSNGAQTDGTNSNVRFPPNGVLPAGKSCWCKVFWFSGLTASGRLSPNITSDKDAQGA